MRLPVQGSVCEGQDFGGRIAKKRKFALCRLGFTQADPYGSAGKLLERRCGGLTMSVDDFWDAGKMLDRLDDTADLVKNARNYADGIDNFRDGSKIVNNLGDTANAGSNAADVGKAVENATDGLKAADQAKYLDDGLDMASGADC